MAECYFVPCVRFSIMWRNTPITLSVHLNRVLVYKIHCLDECISRVRKQILSQPMPYSRPSGDARRRISAPSSATLDHNTRIYLKWELYHFVRTLITPFSWHYIIYPRPTTTQQNVWYTRAPIMCPCSVVKVDTPGTPRICEYCDLLRSITMNSKSSITQHTTEYRACTTNDANDRTSSVSSSCVVYALSVRTCLVSGGLISNRQSYRSHLHRYTNHWISHHQWKP